VIAHAAVRTKEPPDSKRRRHLLSAVCALFVLAGASEARADVSSWMFVGSGPSVIDESKTPAESQAALQVETGLGTPPAHDVIGGGMLRMHTHFTQGTDLGLLLRAASHGFVNGGWGGAVDLGGYQRWWGSGSQGLMGSLVLGAPWGITLSLGAGVGNDEARMYTASLGVDLARLTVYRRTGFDWWNNPFPAYRPEDEGSGPLR
jgi:hypothetical protein